MNLLDWAGRIFRRNPDLLDDLLGNSDTSRKAVTTVVSVVYSTAAKTFDGPAIYVTSTGPLTSSNPTTIVGGLSFTVRSTTPATSSTTSSKSQSTTTTLDPLITNSPTRTASYASASTTAANVSSQKATGGMSGGAKAGLAFGLIILIGLILMGAFALYKQRKRRHEDHRRLDDEKGFFGHNPDSLPSHAEPVASTATFPTASVSDEEAIRPIRPISPISQKQNTVAPRLSLRPITEFSPNLGSIPGTMPRNAAATAAAAAAATGGAVVVSHGMSASQEKSSAWERPAANNIDDPANPFGNHAEKLGGSPPRDAGLDTSLMSSARAPSPTKSINAADFPLPDSSPPTPRFQEPASTAMTVATAPSNKRVSSSDASAALAAGGAAAAGAAAIAAAAAAAASSKPHGPGADNVHRVQLDFKPSMDDELEIKAGQLVRILHEYDDGWALCIRMDRSHQGVVPRTCLSKHAVKPRPASPSGGRPRGPPLRGPGSSGPPPFAQAPRPLTPGSGRNSPAPYANTPHSMTPTGGRNSPAGRRSPPGRNSHAPYAQAPRPLTPTGRSRANSNAVPYGGSQSNGRSMSPGPYGGSNLRPHHPDTSRRRSNSMSNLSGMRKSPPPSRIPAPGGQIPLRKPVAGQDY